MIATAKHFIGDGGTDRRQGPGRQPLVRARDDQRHGQGYYGALAAGAQTVMVSFNSWTNAALGITEGKLHGSKHGAHRDPQGQDGLRRPRRLRLERHRPGRRLHATRSCPQAINAGLDIVMVPHDWKAFIANTVAQVAGGEIPMARIDDAVTRILRVKLRAGLFDAAEAVRAASTPVDPDALRRTARWRARPCAKSLVLLKNNGDAAAAPASAEGARGRQERRQPAEPDRRLDR